MGKKEKGRTIPLSGPRKLMGDLMTFAKAIPTVPVQRRMNLSCLMKVRAESPPAPDRPGWVAIFAKAYGIMADRFPELRRSYLSFPRPRLYEHPCSIASVAIERTYKGENVVLWGHIHAPERETLRDTQARLNQFKQAPIEKIGLFRRALLMGRLPRPLRRFAWWIGLTWSGVLRASHLGTFGISVYSGLGAESLHPITPLTSCLNYGVIQPNGDVDVRIVYDHRVMDGATVARALVALDGILNDEIVRELEQERRVNPHAA